MSPLTRKSLRFASIALACTLIAPGPSAFAANKDMVQLQTQVQALQDAVARLQQSNDERMGVLKDLMQQNSDTVNKMSSVVDALQKQLQTQQEGQGVKFDQVSGQVQGLNDSLDEIKARLGRVEQALKDVQSQQQSMGAALQGAQPAISAPAGDNPAPIPAPAAPVAPTGKRGKPSAAIPQASNDTAPALAPSAAPVAADASSAPPVDQLYKTALGDYMAAKYTLASSEFGDVIHYYPDNPLAGNANYYQGEIEYRAGKFSNAVRSYDRVLDQYPDNNKVPVSLLHKGMALIELKQTGAGVNELRTLIQRYPNSPEAMQARSKLNGMGVAINPKH